MKFKDHVDPLWLICVTGFPRVSPKFTLVTPVQGHNRMPHIASCRWKHCSGYLPRGP